MARCLSCSISVRSWQLLPGKDGLLHISQISQSASTTYPTTQRGAAGKGQGARADEKGRVRLSMKRSKKPLRHSPENPSQAKKGAFGALFVWTGLPNYFATCFSLSSSSVLQSMHSVAVGGPQASSGDLDAAVLAVAVVVRVDARDDLVDLLDEFSLAVAVRSSRAMSDSWLARSLGSANTVASSCIAWTVRSISCDSSTFSASRTLLKCARWLGIHVLPPFFGR